MEISSPKNVKWRHNDVIIVFCNSSVELDLDNLQHWKVSGRDSLW